MKLVVSSYSFWRWMRENNRSLEEAIDLAADIGFAGVEFAGLDEAAKADPLGRAAALRKHVESRGMVVAGYCVGAELLVPPEKQHEAIEALKREVDVAAVLGVKSMRHDVTRGFGAWSEGFELAENAKTFATALKVVVPAIREVATYAKKKRVKTTLENHGFFMQESKRVAKLIDAVAHPNFALTLDMGNFLCVNENPVTAVNRLADRAVMAHVKDFHVRPKSAMPQSGWFATPTEIALRGAIVGHGVIDIPAQLKLLKAAGYRGFLSLEFEGMEEPEKAIRLGFEYLQKLV